MAVMGYSGFIYYPRWNKIGSEAVIAYDVSGYYWYLPSIFIYHDIKQQGFKDKIFDRYSPTPDFQQGYKLPDGNYVMKYSAGMAVMYLPFFTAAHLLAGVAGYPRDGFSVPYELAIQLGGFLIALLGFWNLRKLLLKFYEDKVVAMALLLLLLGTNYLNYSVIDAGMSHTWLFTIYVFVLLNTIHLHETFKLKYAIRVGLLIGLATLARPTEAIGCLLPLLWGMEGLSPAAVKKQLLLLFRHFRVLVVAIGCAAVVVSIQFIYWRYASGHWIVYSYGDQHLYFKSPNFYDYTFSYNTGWLRYTPMMFFAFLGLIPFFINGKNKVAIISFFLINYYIICCWSIWWYGGRAMIQSYPVLIFPIASLLQVVLSRKWLVAVCTPVFLFCIYINVWYLHQCHKGGLYDNTNMTGEYFWRVIGRWHVPESYALLKDKTELYEGEQADKKLLWQTDFESDTTVAIVKNAIGGLRSLELDTSTHFGIERRFACPPPHSQWLEATADVRTTNREGNTWAMTQFLITTYEGGKKQKSNMIRVHRIMMDNETKNLSIFMNVEGEHFDSVAVGFWNGGNRCITWFDNIKVYGFNEHGKR